MRTLGYLNVYRNRGRQCENLALTCMDFRFRSQIGDLLSRADFGDFDLLALPGASKAVIEEVTRRAVFQSLDAALALHGTTRVIIADHADCGAYGGSAAFAGPNDEREFHMGKLREAARIISASYLSIEIVLMYMDWDGLEVVDG